MIIFRNLRWKNFLSTGNFFTELKLDNDNTTLIVGSNGSGKSTMLDALNVNVPMQRIEGQSLLAKIRGQADVKP